MVISWASSKGFIRYTASYVEQNDIAGYRLIEIHQHLLRQYSYRDQYDYSENPAFLRKVDVLYRHVDHCIQVLRINLMCRADVTPYLIEEYDDGSTAVRTDALYRCRNFEGLLDWTNKNVVAPYNVTHERLAAKAGADMPDHHH